MQLQENIIFDNHYTLLRQLGRGGFSEVWLAHDSYMDLDVALKIYAPGKGLDNSSIEEFRHEIKGVFNLNHSNLLKPQYLGVYEKMPYLIMPFCSCGSITKRVGKMQEDEVWKLIHDVASGLAYLHKKDIIHQDIKPDNILLDDNGNYVITDFGISTKARSTLRKSVIGGAVSGGTMAYMGPERFSKQPAPVKASDIWSFGAMVHELITGNVPFGEMGGGMQKGGAEIPEINEPISDKLRQTIESMLALNPWDRPTSEQLVNIKSADISGGRSTQRIVQRSDEIKSKSSLTEKGKGGSGKKTWPWIVFLALLAVGIALFIYRFSYNETESSKEKTNAPVKEQVETSAASIDKSKIEKIISNVCRCSCKGGDYNSLENYFAYTISPHPSGEVRYNYSIGAQTKDYVERFPEYEISSPSNFSYSSSSLPVTVKCDITATWSLNNGTRKRAWIHKTYYFDNDYKITGYLDEEYNRETLQESLFSSGYSLKADIYYRVVFEVNSTIPVYSTENCAGQPSFYLYKGNEFVVLSSQKILYSAQLLSVTRVHGKAFPDCTDNGYSIGDKLYILESLNDGYNLVLNNKREEYACFSIQGDKAVTRYDGCNMIEGDISGYEKSVVTMRIKTTKGGSGSGYVRFVYDYKERKSDWGAVTTWWNKDYNN